MKDTDRIQHIFRESIEAKTQAMEQLSPAIAAAGHLVVIHCLCDLIDRTLFNNA